MGDMCEYQTKMCGNTQQRMYFVRYREEEHFLKKIRLRFAVKIYGSWWEMCMPSNLCALDKHCL